MKTKGKVFIIFKSVFVIAFVVFAVFVLFMKVDNQPITVVVETQNGIAKSIYSAEEIISMSEFEMAIDGRTLDDIREIRLYRYFSTVCIDKITTANLDRYATIEDGAIYFNNLTVDLLKSNSKSFLCERLFIVEVAFGIITLLWIIVNAIEEKTSPNSKGNHGPIHEGKRFIGDIVKYWQFMVYAAKADLRAEVANSYLNRLWWLLEPLFSMLVYVIVFGRIMGNSVENYATFTFSALLMWTFFSKTINYSVKCVRNNRDIVTKVYVPKHVLLISNMILNMFKLLFSLVVLIPMLLIFKVHVGINILWLLPAYIIMILLSFGAGMILLHFGVYIDDLAYAVNILLQMLMFLSGIFYDVITSLPTPLNIMMLELNPVSMFVDTMRNALLGNLVTNVPLVILWTVLSVLLCYIGVHIVYKNENGYVKVV